MSFPTESSNMHIWDNAAFERSGDFTGESTSLPLSPISINLSLFPRLHSSKEGGSPRLTFTTSIVTARPSKRPRMPEADDDDTVEAEIEETENEIRLLATKLLTLRNKKANKDLKAAILKPPETSAAATGSKKKESNFAAYSSVMPCCRKRGANFEQPEKGGKPPLPKRPKPAIVKVPEGRNGAAAVCAKKAVKREDAATGSRKLGTLLRKRQNPAAGKRPEKRGNREAAASPPMQPELDQKRKRREWFLPPESCRKGFPFFKEPKAESSGAFAGSH